MLVHLTPFWDSHVECIRFKNPNMMDPTSISSLNLTANIMVRGGHGIESEPK